MSTLTNIPSCDPLHVVVVTDSVTRPPKGAGKENGQSDKKM